MFDRSGAESGPRVKQGGRLAWLLWHSAYFTLTLSLRNKCVVRASSRASLYFDHSLLQDFGADVLVSALVDKWSATANGQPWTGF